MIGPDWASPNRGRLGFFFPSLVVHRRIIFSLYERDGVKPYLHRKSNRRRPQGRRAPPKADNLFLFSDKKDLSGWTLLCLLFLVRFCRPARRKEPLLLLSLQYPRYDSYARGIPFTSIAPLMPWFLIGRSCWGFLGVFWYNLLGFELMAAPMRRCRRCFFFVRSSSSFCVIWA